MIERSSPIARCGRSSDLVTTRCSPAYGVARFLQAHGKRIVPVHPRAAEVHGEQGYPSLADIPFPVDVVDVFAAPTRPDASSTRRSRSSRRGLDAVGRDRCAGGRAGSEGRPRRRHGPLPGDRVAAARPANAGTVMTSQTGVQRRDHRADERP